MDASATMVNTRGRSKENMKTVEQMRKRNNLVDGPHESHSP